MKSEKTGDEDRFKLSVAENEVIEVQIEAGQVGTPLEALLRIEDAKGAELVRAEDAVYPRDPRIEWRAGKQGVVCVVPPRLPGGAAQVIAIGCMSGNFNRISN